MACKILNPLDSCSTFSGAGLVGHTRIQGIFDLKSKKMIPEIENKITELMVKIQEVEAKNSKETSLKDMLLCENYHRSIDILTNEIVQIRLKAYCDISEMGMNEAFKNL